MQEWGLGLVWGLPTKASDIEEKNGRQACEIS